MYVIVIKTKGEINAVMGIYPTEKEANFELSRYQMIWYMNKAIYKGEVVPFNDITGNTIKATNNETLYIGEK